MPTKEPMKTRTIVLTLVGIVIYFMLASYHGKMKKRLPLTEEHPPALVEHVHPSHQQPDTTHQPPPQEHPPKAQHEIVVEPKHDDAAKAEHPSQDAKEQHQVVEEQKGITLKHAITPPAEDTVDRDDIKLAQQQFQKALAHKDARVKQLLRAQKVIEGNYQELRKLYESVQAEAEALNKGKINLERKVKETLMVAPQLSEAQRNLEETKKNLATANSRIEGLAKKNQATAANLATTKSTIQQLKAALVNAELNSKKSEKIVQENEDDFSQLQDEYQEQIGDIGRLKARLTDTSAQLAITKKELKKAELKAEAMFHFGKEKEKALIPSQERTLALDQQVKEQEAALVNAAATVETLTVKIEQQQQALTAANTETEAHLKALNLAQEEIVLTREDLAKATLLQEETSARAQDLETQVTGLKENQETAGNELLAVKTELEKSNAAKAELEYALDLSQNAMDSYATQETEQKAALENLQTQIAEKDAIILTAGETLAQVKADKTVIEEEKQGLADKLASQEAAQQELETLKIALDEKTAALAESATQLENINALQTQLDETQAKVEETTAALTEATAQVEALMPVQSQLEEAQTKAAEMTTALDEKTAALTEATAQLETIVPLQTQLEEAQAQVAAMTITLDEKSTALTEATTQIESMVPLQTQVMELTTTLDEKNEALNQATAQIEVMTSLQAQLEEAQAKTAELSATLDEKTVALSEAAAQQEALAALETQLQEISTENNALKEQLESAVAKSSSLEEAQQMLTQENTLLTEKANAGETAKSELNALQASLSTASEALASSEAKIAELTAAATQVQALQAELSATKEQAAASTASLEELKQTLATDAGKVQSLEEELTGAQAKIAELTAAAQLSVSSEALQEHDTTIESLNQQVTQLKDQVTGLETNQTKAAGEVATLTTAMKEKNESLQSMQDEKDNLQKIIDNSKATITELETKTSKLEAELASIKKERQELALQTTDSDKDGVSDAEDKCADTVEGAVVDESGCEKDSDNDKLVDRLDLCPDSAEGTSVNELGCDATANIILSGVTFQTGTADLTDDAGKSLAPVVLTLQQYPQIQLEVAGYTDSIGDVNRNLKISQLRAQAVMQFMIENGIAADRLVAKGYGIENPIADNKTREGRAKNRRVELHQISE